MKTKPRINIDASPQTIKLFENRIKGIEQSLKIRGITDYLVVNGTVEITRGSSTYQYSVLRHKWSAATTVRGTGIDSFIEVLKDKN